MPLSSTPRVGATLTAVLLVVVSGCKAVEVVGPDKKVSFIEVTPKTVRMYILGDSAKFTAAITTEAGTAGAGIEIGWIARDKSLLSVSSSGVAKSLKRGGSTYVVATAGGKSDSAFVEVPATPCGTVTPTSLTVGQVVTDIGADGFCAANTPDAEYTAIALNNSLASAATVSIEVIGQALGTPPVSSGAALASRASFMRPTGLFSSTYRQRDARLEAQRRDAERTTLSPLVASAQAWYKTRSKGALRSAAVPAVGDLVSVNVNLGLSCNATTMRNARVAAVSTSAIMLDDTANPTGGFTDAEYASMAATFDTLVNPVNLQNFGAPTDLDGNSRIMILMTRAVNELTAANAQAFTAGLTMARDLFPKTEAGGKQGCAASNVGEIFYMLAPDSSGTINGNPFSRALVNKLTVGTIAHEYQHMINFSRRMYLLGFTSDKWFDEAWVHEGLSHMAEELVFYRAGGSGPRNNLGLTQLVANGTILGAFNNYMVSDFFLYDAFAEEAASTSPYRQVDGISTRGATWSFFRYAADQLGTTDGDLWFRLVNSGLIGMANVQTQFGFTSAAGFQGMLRDFAISVYADDYVNGIVNKYKQPSWNMRSIYPGFQPPITFPLVSNKLVDNTATAGTLVAGGFGVYRFKGLNGTESLVRVTGTSGGAMPPSITMSVIRTK